MSTSPKRFIHNAQLAATCGLLVLFPILIWYAGRAGYASLLSKDAARAIQVEPANAAVSFAPGDPEVHYLRGAIMEAGGDLTAAIAEYDKAVSLRPDDFVLWLTLARARELDGDTPGALAAARQAVPLAPFYAQPHWQLGNILVRARQRDEGFKELRLAGASNPTLLPGIVELAWQISGGDVQFVKQAIEPHSPEAYKVLAENFRKHGKIEDAIAMFGAAGAESRPVRAEYLKELISTKRFKAAFVLWSQDHSANSANPNAGFSPIIDPGFEQESNLGDAGFGWRSDIKTSSLSLSLEPFNQKEGHSSLRVEFKGDSDPAATIISQLVLIEPKTNYQIRFSYRTESIVSGGLPNVFVLDAHDNKVLGQSGALSQTTEGWRDATIDFVSGEFAEAVQITLQRERCVNSPCPIFGRLWLDGFLLQKR